MHDRKKQRGLYRKLHKCVKSIVDKIIIADTGSTDNTKEIAKKYSNKSIELNGYYKKLIARI